MRRNYPTRKCNGCKRMRDGQFTRSCRLCANRYTGEYVSRGAYEFMGEVLTVREWSEMAGCSVRALYVQLKNASGNIDDALRNMGRLKIVIARIEGKRNER